MYQFKTDNKVFSEMMNNINKESESMAFKTTETTHEICPCCLQAHHKIAELEKEIDEINKEYSKQEDIIAAMISHCSYCEHCPINHANNLTGCALSKEIRDNHIEKKCRENVKSWFIKQMEGENE